MREDTLVQVLSLIGDVRGEIAVLEERTRHLANLITKDEAAALIQTHVNRDHGHGMWERAKSGLFTALTALVGALTGAITIWLNK